MTGAVPSGELSVAVIGGSGLYAMEGLEGIREHRIETPFGPPSDLLMEGRLNGTPVVFMARHGRHHHLLPTEVPYRANIWALRSLGVRYLIGCCAVGSLQESIGVLDAVVPNQFIDRTVKRQASFFGEGCVAHIGFADPCCPVLSQRLHQAAAQTMTSGHTAHGHGTYVCIEGPAFSTRAESQLYRRWQGDVIGMTSLTEAKLAREAEIAYACLAMVTDYDCWHEGHDSVNVEMVLANLRANVATTQAILRACLPALGAEQPESPAHHALATALLTAPDQVPGPTRQRLDLLTQSYWGAYQPQGQDSSYEE